ncbi:hypothetical protein [Nonomuraea dietziae]|uniref:hypothetical protein n=1 Tax=Nonomuraea dietziae TaxID=65515 RepID=UPI00341AD3A8
MPVGIRSVAVMPPSKRAVEAWSALNERQRIYMRIIYRADQDAERLAKGRDPGAGATLAVLAGRGLVETTHRPGFVADVPLADHARLKPVRAARAELRDLNQQRATRPNYG